MTKKEYETRYNRLKSTGLYTEEEIQQLIIDDEKVDKADYDDAISNAFNFDKATRLNKDAVEYEEFKKLVENYK